ncbi:MAG: hypothetical protein ACEPOW_12305 [Bacteroidales bacterium]
MKRTLLILGFALFLVSNSFSQENNYQYQWYSGKITKWYKNHDIVLSQSGFTGGNYRFVFADSNDQSYWSAYTPSRGNVLSIFSNGKIGIGTGNEEPAELFHIKSKTRLDADLDWTNGKIFNLLGQSHGFKFDSDSLATNFIFTNSQEQKLFTITGNGFVGIGTDNPEKNFDLKGDARFQGKSEFKGISTFTEKVGIGINNPTENLEVAGNVKVNGTIFADRVSLNLGSFPDYVFEKSYNLRSLPEVEKYIEQHKHLPGVPSADEMVKQGLDLRKMNTILMEKVEELTLYTIDQDKKLQLQDQQMMQLQKEINELKAIIKK